MKMFFFVDRVTFVIFYTKEKEQDNRSTNYSENSRGKPS